MIHGGGLVQLSIRPLINTPDKYRYWKSANARCREWHVCGFTPSISRPIELSWLIADVWWVTAITGTTPGWCSPSKASSSGDDDKAYCSSYRLTFREIDVSDVSLTCRLHFARVNKRLRDIYIAATSATYNTCSRCLVDSKLSPVSAPTRRRQYSGIAIPAVSTRIIVSTAL